MIYVDIVLDLDTISNMNPCVDINIFPKDALPPNYRALPDLCVIPYLRADPNQRAAAYFRRFVNHDIVHGSCTPICLAAGVIPQTSG